MWDTLLTSASPKEFVGLFISTPAYRLTLKCHCYSGSVLWETIKNTPLNPIYKLPARLCVHGKLHRLVQHINGTKLHHLTMWTVLSAVNSKCIFCSQWVSMYACAPISVWIRATQWEKIGAIVIFQCLREAVVPFPLAVSETLQTV